MPKVKRLYSVFIKDKKEDRKWRRYRFWNGFEARAFTLNTCRRVYQNVLLYHSLKGIPVSLRPVKEEKINA